MKEDRAVVCLSGGADSATLLYFAITQCKYVYAISINYGQRHVRELKCAKKLCEINNIPHIIVPFDLTIFGGSPLTDDSMEVPAQSDQNQTATVVPYRNTFIATIAAAYCQANDLDIIYIGSTYEDLANYSDCRPIFFDALQKALLLGGTVHNLEIRTPFINVCKEQIIRLGHFSFGVPYKYTYTCYVGQEEPCMVCDACRERLESFRLNEVCDPLVSEEKWDEYMNEFEKSK